MGRHRDKDVSKRDAAKSKRANTSPRNEQDNDQQRQRMVMLAVAVATVLASLVPSELSGMANTVFGNGFSEGNEVIGQSVHAKKETDSSTAKSTIRSKKDILRLLEASEAITSPGPGADRALRLMLEAVQHSPASVVPELHIEIANKYDITGNEEKVESHLRRAIETSKNIKGSIHGYAAFGLASFMLRSSSDNRRAEVIDLLRVASKRLPNDADVNHWLGHQLMRSTEGYVEAEKHLAAVDLQKLTKSVPLDTVMLLAQAKERLGKLEESAEAFKQTYNLQRQLESAGQTIEGRFRYRFMLGRFQYCRIMIILGDYGAALDFCGGSIQEFPESFHLRDITAFALAKLNNVKSCVEVYSEYYDALTHWPNDHQIMPLRVMGATSALVRELHEPLKGSWQDTFRSTEQRESAFDDNGGWPTRVVDVPFSTTRCNIDRRHKITKEEFLRDYVDRNRPVLLSGLLDDWPAKSAWMRDNFHGTYGEYNISVRQSRQVAYDNEFGGLHTDTMTIRQYISDVIETKNESVEYNPPYLLSASLKTIPGLSTDHMPLEYFDDIRFGWNTEERTEAALMYLGVAGSGVTLHEHTNAWNALVYGRKHWILLPPYVQYGPTHLPHHEWMQNWYPKFASQAYECTQYAGEVLYVPTNWMHSLINLQASIGIAVETGANTKLLDVSIRSIRNSLLRSAKQ